MFFQFLDEGWNERLMPGSKTGSPNHMDIIFNSHFGRFFRRLEHRTDIHVKTEIGIGAGDHLEAAVMSVLAHFGDQQPRASALFFKETWYVV